LTFETKDKTGGVTVPSRSAADNYEKRLSRIEHALPPVMAEHKTTKAHGVKLTQQVSKLEREFRDHPAIVAAKGKERVLELGRKALADPFSYAPPGLGFDSFAPPVRGTAYAKSQFTLNATDGSGTIIVNPNFNNLYITTNSLFATNPTSETWNPATNASAELTQVTNARPLSLGIRFWCDEAGSGPPGVVYMGQVDISSTTCGTSTFTGATSTTNAYLCKEPYCLTTAYEIWNGTTMSAPASYTCLGYSTQDFCMLPATKEELGCVNGLHCVWRPEDPTDLEDDPCFGGGMATKVIFPAQDFNNTNTLGNIGGASGSLVIADPTYAFAGPQVFVAFNGFTAGTPIMFDIEYTFEYTADGKQGASYIPLVSDHFASAASYYRELFRPIGRAPIDAKFLTPYGAKKEELKAPTNQLQLASRHKEPKEEKKIDREVRREERKEVNNGIGSYINFFSKVGKHVKDAIESPLGEMLLEGVTSLFMSVHKAQLQVIRRGRDFLLNTPRGWRFMTTEEVKDFYIEQAQNSVARSDVKLNPVNPPEVKTEDVDIEDSVNVLPCPNPSPNIFRNAKLSFSTFNRKPALF